MEVTVKCTHSLPESLHDRRSATAVTYYVGEKETVGGLMNRLAIDLRGVSKNSRVIQGGRIISEGVQ